MKNLNFPGLPRVLVVDDEEGVREGVCRILQLEGAAVDTTDNADDAFECIPERVFVRESRFGGSLEATERPLLVEVPKEAAAESADA